MVDRAPSSEWPEEGHLVAKVHCWRDAGEWQFNERASLTVNRGPLFAGPKRWPFEKTCAGVALPGHPGLVMRLNNIILCEFILKIKIAPGFLYKLSYPRRGTIAKECLIRGVHSWAPSQNRCALCISPSWGRTDRAHSVHNARLTRVPYRRRSTKGHCQIEKYQRCILPNPVLPKGYVSSNTPQV